MVFFEKPWMNQGNQEGWNPGIQDKPEGLLFPKFLI